MKNALTKDENKIETLSSLLETFDKDSLKYFVASDILEHESPLSYLEDVLQYGCSGGSVSSLVYYADTEAFYTKYMTEIHDLLAEYLEDGLLDGNTLASAFKGNFANWCAWCGYEVTAMQLSNEIGE